MLCWHWSLRWPLHKHTKHLRSRLRISLRAFVSVTRHTRWNNDSLRDRHIVIPCLQVSFQNLWPLVCWLREAICFEVKLGELVTCGYRKCFTLLSLIPCASTSSWMTSSSSPISQTSCMVFLAICTLTSWGNFAMMTGINRLPYRLASTPSASRLPTCTLTLS